MTRMRRVVKGNNIYRWAANLIGAVSEIRLEMPASVKSPPGLTRHATIES
jgi:hypothetical protein